MKRILPILVGGATTALLYKYSTNHLKKEETENGKTTPRSIVPKETEKPVQKLSKEVEPGDLKTMNQWDYVRTSDEDYIMYFSKNLAPHKQHRVLVKLPHLAQNKHFYEILRGMDLSLHRKSITFKKHEYFELALDKTAKQDPGGSNLLAKVQKLIEMDKQLGEGKDINRLLPKEVRDGIKERNQMMFYKVPK